MNKRSKEYKSNNQDFETIRNRMRNHGSQLRKDKQIIINKERNLENLNQSEVENIINKISTYYDNKDPINAFQLMKEISKSSENGIDILISRSLFEPMFSCMNTEIVPCIIISCLDHLSYIIDESFGSISSILNSDLLNILQRVFHLDDTVKCSIFNLLSVISCHGQESCDFVLLMNISDLLIALSSTCFENSKVHICKTIKNIFHDKTDLYDHIARDLLKILRKCTQNSDLDCKLDIIWSFLYLLDSSFIPVDDIIDKEIVLYFIELLRNKNESINVPILKIFSSVYNESNTLKTILLENKVLSCLSTLFPISKLDCWKECIFFLNIVASGTSDELIALRASDILPWITFSLSNGTYRIQEEVVYFLKNIAKQETGDQISFWITKDIVFLLCKLLLAGNIDMNCIILDTLICALIYSSNNEELGVIITECNVINAVEESKFHMTDCGYKLYKDLLSILTGEDNSDEIEMEEAGFNF